MGGGVSGSAAMSGRRIERVRIVRAHRSEDAAQWAAALADGAWVGSSTLLKEDGGSWVRRAQVLGREVVVKRRELSAWARVKCAIGRGKGDRHWRGAALLSGKGVGTARVLVLARASVDGRDCELLVMEWVQGETLLRVMADVHSREPNAPGVCAQHAIAQAVGRQIAQMGELFNRDHKPSNLIVQGAAEGGPRIAIVDCEGVRRATVPGAARMFASLVIEPTGCGVRPRRGWMMRAVRGWLEETREQLAREGRSGESLDREWYRGLRRMMWGDVARVVAQHGDPTPRVNPLKVPPTESAGPVGGG